MGGAIAVLNSAKNIKVGCLVLISPLIKNFKQSKNKSSFFDSKKSVSFKDCMGRERQLNAEYFKERAEYDFFEEAKKINIPALVIAADKDETVSWRDCELFYQKLDSKKKMIVAKGQGHFYRNEISGKLLKAIVDFVSGN